MEDKVYQSLLGAWTPEKPEKKLLRIMVRQTGAQYTPVEQETTHTYAICYKHRAKLMRHV